MSLKLAVLASGRGSNLEAIASAINLQKLSAQVKVVLSNNPESGALRVAKAFGISAILENHEGLSRQAHEELLIRHLNNYAPDYIVLAGYMRVLTPYFLRHFQDPQGFYRVLNIHPSLLPAFPGAAAYEDAFNYGVCLSGITVHLVDAQIDHGPILAQESFPRLPGDTLAEFKKRGLEIEHRLYVKVLNQIAREGVNFFPRAAVEAHT